MPASGIQLLLTAVILILTSLLVFIGVQVILIFRELHRAAKRLNQALSPLSATQHSQPTSSWNLFQQLVKKRFGSVQQINADVPPVDAAEQRAEQPLTPKATPVFVEQSLQSAEEIAPSFPHIAALQEKGRRVFYKDGKPLA